MRVERYLCDNCEKQAQKHYYDEVGWIHIEGVTGITTTQGRRKDGTAKTKFTKPRFKEDLLFCSTKCLLEFIKKRGR